MTFKIKLEHKQAPRTGPRVGPTETLCYVDANDFQDALSKFEKFADESTWSELKSIETVNGITVI